MMCQAQVKQAAGLTVAYTVMRGPYDQTPSGYRTLYGWVGRHGLQPVGMPHAVYLTMPDQAPESEAVWE